MRFVADFETSTQEWYEVEHIARVWASAWVDIDRVNEEDYGHSLHIENNIENFIRFLDHLKGEHDCYFHNLKFDGQYLLHHLLTHGFKEDEKLSEPNTFRTLITDMGIFYTITVRFTDKPELTPKGKQKMRKGKPVFKKTVITFKDSLKKIPLKVSQIAKAYGIEEQKTTIDYKAYRPVGHKLTDEEKEYVSNDVVIVAKALAQMFSEGQVSLTMSSDAMSDFKHRLVGLPRGTSKDKEKADEYFRLLFPLLEKETDDFIRTSYKGGYTYCNPKYASQIVHDGLVYDVNSLYPSCMRDCLLPYGKPVYVKGELMTNKKYPLFIQRFICTCRLKPDHLPTLQIKGSGRFNESEYLTHLDKAEILTMTNIDLDLFFEHYDVDYYEPIEGYYFKGKKGLFNKYIEYWGNIKKNSVGGKRQLAKLMLNSLYGKFATQTKSQRKIPYYDEEKDKVCFHYVVDDDREPIYTAMASFITAYARDKMIRSAQTCYDRFLYCDTDSLHVLGLNVPNIDIDPVELGYWKCEGVFHQGKYLRAKTYAESFYTDDSYHIITDPSFIHTNTLKSDIIDVKCAGMPDDCKKEVSYELFEIGAEWEHGKLGMKTVKGGCILYETSFKIKAK